MMTSLKKQELFVQENEDSSDEEDVIKINQKYATEYENRKQRQELLEHKETGSDSESSSTDESEDEDGNLLTATMDVSILKTINALRNKDESIYDPSTRFFPEEDREESSNSEEPEKKHKPQRFKDVIREQILQQINEDENNNGSRKNEKERQKEESMSKLEYDEEQRALRSAFLDSTENQDEEKEEDWMVLKQKSEQKVDQEADRLLQEELKVYKKTANDKDELKDPHGEVENGNEFLIDFIKNKKWIDRTDRAEDVDDDAPDDDSIQQLERTDEFESQYNFRFEQAASASGADHSMISYSRGGDAIPTLRRKDETRRLKRLQQKENKAAKRKAKEEQLRRLKNAKRQEMQERLQKIKGVLANDEEGTMDEATMMKLMEGDYDPAKFEQVMNEAYSDDFYQRQDAEWKTDGDVRESLLHDDDGNVLVGEDGVDGGMYDNYEETGEEEQEGEDADEWDTNMDTADYNYDDEGLGFEPDRKETEAEKKLKQKMMDELYKLDYEDIVAGMPTRFKYRTVEANNFGLSTKEILFARDTTLKQFVSLKKMAPYREEGEYYVTGKKRRRFKEIVKHDINEEMKMEADGRGESTVDGRETEGQSGDVDLPTKKKRRRQKKAKKKEGASHGNVERSAESEGVHGENGPEEKNGKKRRRKKGSKKQATEPAVLQETASEVEKDQQVLGDDKTGLRKSVHSDHVDAKDKNASPVEMECNRQDREQKKRKKKERRKKRDVVEGVSKSRLASYGL